MRISDWSSDVCSSDLGQRVFAARGDWLDGAADPARLVTKAQLERLMEGVTLSRHAPATAGATLPAVSNPFTAGFVVADRWSSAVACRFTMNGLFGAGRVVPGPGVLLPQTGSASCGARVCQSV